MWRISTHLKLIPLAFMLVLLPACGRADPTAKSVLSEVEVPAPTAPHPASEIRSATPTATPAEPDRSSTTIAFTSERDGNMEIYLMDTDGSVVHRLTTNPAEDYWPTWSPDGTQIAFASNQDGDFDIFVINVADILLNAGNPEPRRLTQEDGNDLEPAWSPDGSKIAFMVHQANQSDVYTMKPDGSARIRLTEGTGSNYLPKWSPDGSKIVFVSERDGNPEIYTMNTDGSAQTRLTDNPADDRYPAWSSQGDYISFYSDRDGHKELYRINADGQNPLPLTDDNAAVWVSDWSPDGNQIAFTSKRDGNREIYLMDTDGSNLRRLTDNNVLDGIPAWRPVTAVPLPSMGTGNVSRGLLTYTDLMDGFDASPPSMKLPSPSRRRRAPAHIFEGRLELHGEDTGEMTVLRGAPTRNRKFRICPSSISSSCSRRLPHPCAARPDHRRSPYWNYIIEPGRVWQENAIRAIPALPFPLHWSGKAPTPSSMAP